MSVKKNCASTHEGFPTHFSGPRKVFWEKYLGAQGTRSMGQYSQKS